MTLIDRNGITGLEFGGRARHHVLAEDGFVRESVASGLDRTTMCGMNRVAGSHASPFPFPITPERRAPAS